MLDLSLDSFFNEKLSTYFYKNKISVHPEATKYLISILKKFLIAEEIKYTTLFDIYKKCVEGQEFVDYKYLGDHSLYMAGVFPSSLSRSLVGLDYYIQMGQIGYQSASNLSLSSENRDLYSMMAGDFKVYMNSLYSISQESLFKDRMNLYDTYIQSENPEIFRDLLKMGIIPHKN